MTKSAFTIMELTAIIVVLGILAMVAMPRLQRDLRQELKDNILSAIRYTQHLALTDDKCNPYDAKWQMRLWKISFSTSKISNRAFFYTISSDINQNGYVSKNESAIDPSNGKYMYNSNANTTIDRDESSTIFIGKRFGVNKIDFSGGCSSVHHIAFDHYGRAYSGVNKAKNLFAKYMKFDCLITIYFADTNIEPLKITIQKESGYVSAD